METHEYIRRAFDDAAIGIAILAVHPLGKYLEVNPTFCRMTGYTRSELLTRDFQSITASQDVDRNLEQVRTLLNGAESSMQLEKRYVRKDGTAFWACLNASVVRDDEKRPLYLIVQIEDIDQRKRAEEALKHSISLLQATLESTADGLLVVDPSGKIVSFNQQFARMWKIPDDVLAARDDHQALTWVLDQLKNPDQFLQKVQQLYATPEAESYDVLEFKDGRVFERFSIPQRIDGRPVGRVWSFRDATERKGLEEQLRHAHKLEAVGQLAGGIAHEFNNLLTAIIGNLDLALPQTPPDSDLHTILANAQQAARRAAMLTQQLLTFSRRNPVDLEPHDLQAIAQEVVRLLRQTIDRRFQITVESADGLWPVLADADQMNQVVMNLCVNARDALMERLAREQAHSGSPAWQPAIRIRTENVIVDEAYCRTHPEAQAGQFVCLSVADNGCGIDDQIRPHIFEPFFTTKQAGQGTGLGLATVYGIIEQHNGWIELSSQKDQGTAFKLYLPRTGAPALATVKSEREETAVGGNETVLFVDDERPIRQLGQTILEHHGYTVLQAQDGAEALEVFQRDRQRIRLVILDLTMPHMSGQEVLRRLRRLEPGVKIIVSTGQPAFENPGALNKLGADGFVPKPYHPLDLARTVRSVLDHPKRAVISPQE